MRPVPRYATVSNIDENHINSTDVTFIEKNTSERKQFHEEAFSATDELYILVQLNNLTARTAISKLFSRLQYLILVFVIVI